MSEEFISQDSGSLNLRNALKDLEKQETREPARHQNAFIPVTCARKESASPYERPMDRKRFEMKREGHKRPYL